LRTVAGVFSSVPEAQKAGIDLEQIGVPRENIGVIAGNDASRHDEYLAKVKHETVTPGSAAASDAALGGGLGIIATLIALSIPGVGPILAIGPFATIAAGMGVGAASGGLIGAFYNMGIGREDAPLYEEAVRRGAVIVVAQVGEPLEDEAVRIMSRHGARDIRDEWDTWKAAGWSGGEDHPYVSDDSVRTSSKFRG